MGSPPRRGRRTRKGLNVFRVSFGVLRSAFFVLRSPFSVRRSAFGVRCSIGLVHRIRLGRFIVVSGFSRTVWGVHESRARPFSRPVHVQSGCGPGQHAGTQSARRTRGRGRNVPFVHHRARRRRLRRRVDRAAGDAGLRVGVPARWNAVARARESARRQARLRVHCRRAGQLSARAARADARPSCRRATRRRRRAGSTRSGSPRSCRSTIA